VVSGTVSDVDGDTLAYEWLKGTEVLASGSIVAPATGDPVALADLVIAAGDEGFPIGLHTVTLEVSDGINAAVTSDAQVRISSAPTLSPESSVAILWPPNHELRPVTIWANAADESGGGVTIEVAVESSEPEDDLGDGTTQPDYYIDDISNEDGGVIQLRLRAERSGIGDGRTYTVTITATNAAGLQSLAVVEIRAPHSRKK
jgi:hypothetical protein